MGGVFSSAPAKQVDEGEFDESIQPVIMKDACCSDHAVKFYQRYLNHGSFEKSLTKLVSDFADHVV